MAAEIGAQALLPSNLAAPWLPGTPGRHRSPAHRAGRRRRLAWTGPWETKASGPDYRLSRAWWTKSACHPGRERLHEFVVQAPVAQNINTIPHDGGRRVAVANVLSLPNQPRAILGPFLKQAGFGGDTVPLRSAPLGPVGRIGSKESRITPHAQLKSLCILIIRSLGRLSPQSLPLSMDLENVHRRRILAHRARLIDRRQ